MTGHLDLSRTERVRVREQLRHRVLAAAVDGLQEEMPSPGTVELLTGLAPGADYLFAITALEWYRRQGIRFRLTVLQPLPIDTLMEDWARHRQRRGRRVRQRDARRALGELRELIRASDQVVDLMPNRSLRRRSYANRFRQIQYRRLAATLALSTDVLVAILRSRALTLPGGTAEVVAWWREPHQIPQMLSSPFRIGPSHRQLLLIDPLPQPVPAVG